MSYKINYLIKLLCFAIFSLALPEKVFAQKEITLATIEYEPYIGKNLPHKGYVYEVVHKVFTRMGYKIKIGFYPLKRAKISSINGYFDGMVPAYYDDANIDDFVYSVPFPGDNIVLLKMKNSKVQLMQENGGDVNSILAQLKNYTIGLLRGTNGASFFLNNKILKTEVVSYDIQNIDKLVAKRVDFILIDKYTAADIMVKHRPHFIGKIEQVKPALSSNSFHLAISKKTNNYQEKINDFNEGLNSIIDDGTLDNILSKHGLLSASNKVDKKVELVIGTVKNKEMLIMQKLSTIYEKENPNIKLTWRVLDENTLRKRLMGDMAISDGQFDVVTIGGFETSLWPKKGWLTPLINLPHSYDKEDIIDAVRQSLLYKGELYALPFYGESSMTFYRKDLFEKANIKMPNNPTYEDIESYAKKIHDPSNGVYGICLRGKAGWGANMAFFNTLVNTYGGRWFNKDWKPTLNTPEWINALTLYKELVTNYGPPSTPENNFNENKELFSNGNCGIWIDSTVAAGLLFDPKQSKVSTKTGLANSPTVMTKKGSHWLWVWSLGIPSSSNQKSEALKFLTWATSKEYIKLVAKNYGWVSVPPGTRMSTYLNPEYKKVAPFSIFVLSSIQSADSNDNTFLPSPYKGISYINIPEYPSLGDKVGNLIQRVIRGTLTIEEALREAQFIVESQMHKSGYYP